ncbi:hypothetical protein ZIOFF_069106 [Zingiber officinale]|uniref:RING-CH-type domain-containing protein n=1 Tax=Zingiber officinale TaxID=94328 RepID=A0A8J5C3N9_ZINOF|nr:hypothetical protein ZIOFF_069106 [Zingiber officinale]
MSPSTTPSSHKCYPSQPLLGQASKPIPIRLPNQCPIRLPDQFPIRLPDPFPIRLLDQFQLGLQTLALARNAKDHQFTAMGEIANQTNLSQTANPNLFVYENDSGCNNLELLGHQFLSSEEMEGKYLFYDLKLKSRGFVKAFHLFDLASIEKLSISPDSLLKNKFRFLFGVMGDHFVLLVDRLLTESTLEAAIESINHGSSMPLPTLEADYSPTKKIIGDGVFTGKMVECRICQDEDEDIHMEIPCLLVLKVSDIHAISFLDTLQFAHRKCVQKWCNEKGDTTCEICLQQFEPGYTAPPKLFLYGTTPMHFRGNWEVSRQNIHNQQSLTMSQTEHVFLRPTYDYAGLSDRNIIYCRIAATTFMIILVLWHSLTFITDETEQCSILLLVLLLLKIVGIVLPIYVTLRALSVFYQRKLQVTLHFYLQVFSKYKLNHPSFFWILGNARFFYFSITSRQSTSTPITKDTALVTYNRP